MGKVYILNFNVTRDPDDILYSFDAYVDAGEAIAAQRRDLVYRTHDRWRSP